MLFGIKNLFNKEPPFTNAYQDNFAAGYNSFIADPLLRNFYVNLKYTFLNSSRKRALEAPPRAGLFLVVRPAGRTHSEVKVLYTADMGKC